MRIALAQMCSGIDPAVNARLLCDHIQNAASGGAEILFTPEMTGMLDRDRARAQTKICSEKDDPVLNVARESAKRAKIWVALGSLALKSDDAASDKWVNRSFLIDPNGNITARYDKIHLFDVDLDTGESWRESSVYEGGEKAVIAPLNDTVIGLSICYDLRFPGLYAALANAGANILTIPAAFTVPTGQAHWEILLRARAIESSSFVIAAAQSGNHEDGRTTYGHSMVIDPWGKILLDMDTDLGLGLCDIDMDVVAQVRARVPALANRRNFESPVVPI